MSPVAKRRRKRRSTSKKGSSKHRRAPSQERSRATVDAILDSVSRIIRQDGPEAVTTNRLAQVAGVSIGTLYQYFSNKQDIFDALHEREFQKVAVNVSEAMASAAASLDELIVSVFDAVLLTRMADPELYYLLAHTVPRRPQAQTEMDLGAAFQLAIAARGEELREDVELPLFVYTLGNVMGGVIRSVVLTRPKSMPFEDARAEALKAVRAYVAVYRV